MKNTFTYFFLFLPLFIICANYANAQVVNLTTQEDFDSGSLYFASTTSDGSVKIEQVYNSWRNDSVAVSNSTDTQYSQQIISDGSGGAIITWDDYRNGDDDIYTQRIDSNGNPLWTLNGVAVATSAGGQFSPQIISDSSGGAIITWGDYRSGANGDIYAQRVDSSGTPLWTTNGVAVSTSTNEQGLPQITSDNSGGAIITWQDSRNGNDDIYAQRIDSSGTPLWTLNGVAISTSTGSQDYPQIISDNSGGAIIAWQDSRSGIYDIYAQRVDSSGTPLWTTNGVAVSTSTDNQYLPQLVSDSSGGAIITWYDHRNGNYDIYAQRIDSSGTPLWTLNGVAISTSTGSQDYPQIISDNSGGAIIAWQDERNGNYDIYAQRVDSSGTPLWTTNGVAVAAFVGMQVAPQIISDGSDGTIITWQDNRNGNRDVYVQRIDSSGTPLWTTNGIAVSTFNNIQDYPQIISDGSDGTIITWHDFRNGNDDIYAQKISLDAVLHYNTNSTSVYSNVISTTTSINWNNYELNISSTTPAGTSITADTRVLDDFWSEDFNALTPDQVVHGDWDDITMGSITADNGMLTITDFSGTDNSLYFTIDTGKPVEYFPAGSIVRARMKFDVPDGDYFALITEEWNGIESEKGATSVGQWTTFEYTETVAFNKIGVYFDSTVAPTTTDSIQIDYVQVLVPGASTWQTVLGNQIQSGEGMALQYRVNFNTTDPQATPVMHSLSIALPTPVPDTAPSEEPPAPPFRGGGGGSWTPTYPLSITFSGNGTGTITSLPAGIVCTISPSGIYSLGCMYAYAQGTMVTLSALPQEGSSLASWTGCSTFSTSTCSVTLPATTKTVDVAFVRGTTTVSPTPPTIASSSISTLILQPIRTLLNPGSRHPDVVLLQQFLRAEGFLNPLLPLGYYGPATMEAVKSFQLKHAITSIGAPRVTGYGFVGSKTRGVINILIEQKYHGEQATSAMTKLEMEARIMELLEYVRQLQAKLLTIQRGV
jgi:hypothetical protein